MPTQKTSRGHEQNHVNQHESDFKTDARRNKLLGLWLAGEMGVEDAEAYAKEVVIADLDEPGVEDVMRKVMADISECNAAISEDQVRTKLDDFLVQAKAELAVS